MVCFCLLCDQGCVQDKPRTPFGRKKDPSDVPGVQDSEKEKVPPGAASGEQEGVGGSGRGEDQAQAEAHAEKRKEKQADSAPGGTSAKAAVKSSSNPDQAGGNKATITSTDEELPPTPEDKIIDAKWVGLVSCAYLNKEPIIAAILSCSQHASRFGDVKQR